MALDITKVDVWAADIPDQTGTLANILDQLASAGADLESVIARREPGKPAAGTVFLCPIKGRAMQNAAKQAGLSPASKIGTLRVEGPNRPGMGHQILQAVADAGINLRGVSAVVIGNKFAVYLGFDNPADATKATRALKTLDKAPKSRAKARARR
jgi:hypothetical protein